MATARRADDNESDRRLTIHALETSDPRRATPGAILTKLELEETAEQLLLVQAPPSHSRSVPVKRFLMMSSCSPCSRVLHWLLACLTVLVSSPALAQSSLPAPWSAADVGSPSLTGSTTYGNGTFTVNGGGMGISGRNDQFHFLYQQLNGDTMLVARIDGMTAADPESRVGVMFRENLSASATNAFAYVSGGNALGLSTRTSTNARTTTTPWGTGQPTGWLALRRQGSTLTAYASNNGSSWHTLATSSVPMGQSIYVGIAISARSNTQRAQARVSNVSFAGGLPNGQQAVDIGSPSPAGNTSFASSAYTISGGGANIGGNSDQFHFAYQTVTGDVDLVARVASLTDAMGRAGVMVRASLAANSAFAYTSLRAGSGYGFEWRYTSSASASVTNSPLSVTAGWVRLTRRGQRFDAYRSSDGQTWTLIDTEDLTSTPMPTTVYVGLAVTSARAGASTTATVSNFSANTNLSNGAPTVSLTSPTTQSYAAPATISLAATASDPEGRLSRVEFYNGSTMLASDTSAPYAFTWSGVAAGSYALRARAVDMDNGDAWSTVNVTVTSANQPPTVTLTSSSAGVAVNTDVALTANAADPEGRMSRVEFFVNNTFLSSDASAPYNATWRTSSAGTYTLTAIAYDADGGRTTSAGVVVTVSAPVVTPPRYVAFTASSDHATTVVTGYRLNVFAAGADVTSATPRATSDMGKPTPDAQQVITVDRGSFFTALPAGSYIATVTAYGPGGSAQSMPPVSFTR